MKMSSIKSLYSAIIPSVLFFIITLGYDLDSDQKYYMGGPPIPWVSVSFFPKIDWLISGTVTSLIILLRVVIALAVGLLCTAVLYVWKLLTERWHHRLNVSNTDI